jgi:hypothetical protein
MGVLFKKFERNFDGFIIGFIAGLVLYFISTSNQGILKTALIIFFSGLFLISFYTLSNHIFNKKDKSFFRLLGKIKESEFIFYFIAIPSLLILIYLLPNWITNSFKLDINNITFLTAILSNYTHQNLGHLLGNLGMYVLLIFLILNIETNKKEFYWFSGFALIILAFIIKPIVKLFLYLFQINNFPPSIGFSGIVAFFNGYFIYALYKYFKLKADKNLKTKFILLLLILNIVIWAFFNNLLFGIISLTFFILLCLADLESMKKILKFLNYRMNKEGKINWLFFMKLFFYLIPLFTMITLVPKELVTPAGVINTPVHFFSYLLGIFIPYFYELIKINKLPK